MAKAKYIQLTGQRMVRINCPGCGYPHDIPIESPEPPNWTFNGDMEKPTFHPSLNHKTGKYVDPNYVEYEDDDSAICHSFIRDGKIQFLGECTHQLANQTVDLSEVE